MSKEKKIRIVRFIAFTIFSCILPFSFIAWRYDMFKAKPMALTGWGFFGIIFIVVFALYVAKAFKHCFPHTMFAQCFSGFCKIILPLLALLCMINGIKANIDAFSQALTITIICECIAIPINPIPQFMWENNIEMSNLKMDTFIGKWQEANNKKQVENK